MPTMQITLLAPDVMAALTTWVQNPANFGGVTHQVNATVAPILNANGTIILQLNS